MSKGQTAITRVVLTREEYNQLAFAGRIFNYDRITLGNIERFKLKHEDLRTIPNVDLVILSVA